MAINANTLQGPPNGSLLPLCRFFDPEWNIPLLSSSVGLNLLYIEAVSDVEGGDLDLSQDIKQKLGQLKKSGKRKEV